RGRRLGSPFRPAALLILFAAAAGAGVIASDLGAGLHVGLRLGRLRSLLELAGLDLRLVVLQPRFNRLAVLDVDALGLHALGDELDLTEDLRVLPMAEELAHQPLFFQFLHAADRTCAFFGRGDGRPGLRGSPGELLFDRLEGIPDHYFFNSLGRASSLAASTKSFSLRSPIEWV